MTINIPGITRIIASITLAVALFILAQETSTEQKLDSLKYLGIIWIAWALVQIIVLSYRESKR